MSEWRLLAVQMVIAWAAVAAGPVALATAAPSADAPSAAEIVQRNATARGGKEAWAHALTMVWTGQVESTGARVLHTPFVLEKMRPDRTRFEVANQGQAAVRIFDGKNGWKLIPSPVGHATLEPYTADELRFAHDAQSIEGPLMNYANHHAAIELAGVGEVDGRKAYVLQVKSAEGELHKVWVDTETYLELRQDRSVRNAAGQLAMATVYFRDYHEYNGLQVPATIETRSPDGTSVNRLVVDKVLVNAPLDVHAFDKPSTTGSQHRGVLVDTRSVALPATPP